MVALFDNLARDHRSIMSKVRRLQDAPVLERGKRLRDLMALADAHMRGEEQTLYRSLVEEGGELKELALRQYQEHHACDLFLDELQDPGLDDDIWKAKLSVLSEILERHIENEEGEVFPTAQDFFPPDRLDRMDRDFVSSCNVMRDLSR